MSRSSAERPGALTMRGGAGGIATAIVALLLGILAVSQFRSQDVYSRSLQLETPASLTSLIATLADRNAALRDEILDLRLRLSAARSSVASGQFSLSEGERQLAQLRVLAAEDPVSGPGVAIVITGRFDERAMADLVNELRNAGAEAIAINDRRVGPRSWFAAAGSDAIELDRIRLAGPWTVRAVGVPDVVQVAMTRTGGIVSQFELIYRTTKFRVSKEERLDLPGRR